MFRGGRVHVTHNLNRKHDYGRVEVGEGGGCRRMAQIKADLPRVQCDLDNDIVIVGSACAQGAEQRASCNTLAEASRIIQNNEHSDGRCLHQGL